MKTIAALFDSDGTLYSAQYGRELMKYSSENGRKAAAYAYYASLMPLYFLHKAKLVSDKTYHLPVLSRLAWMVKGLTEQEFINASQSIIHNNLLPAERTEVIARMHEHQKNGHAILLVSGMPIPSLKRLGEHYKVTGVVGTKLEVRNGRYTGRIIPPAMTGHAKDHYSREFFTSNNMDVDWESSYAYADSITDMGLFNMVGHPVAVSDRNGGTCP
jgi:HAD superfamily hydrolase (TIGR01490 family)